MNGLNRARYGKSGDEDMMFPILYVDGMLIGMSSNQVELSFTR